MDPQTVNALNLPVQNALNFPAAILVPPYYDPAASAASNYGAVGAIIGHEISHSFDDTGSQFDATGRFVNWWTPEDLAHFKAAADKLVAQYDAYLPFPDLHVNGKLTLGENIADVAGLSAAYRRVSSTGECDRRDRPCVLHQLRAVVESQAPRSVRTATSLLTVTHLTNTAPTRTQRRCVVSRVRCQERAAALSRSTRSRADLVAHRTFSASSICCSICRMTMS